MPCTADIRLVDQDMPSPSGSELHLRMIAEHGGDLISLVDRDGCRLYANPAFVAILGEAGAARGSDTFAGIHVDDRARIREVFERVVTSGIGERAEYRFIGVDGLTRHFESRSDVVIGLGGQVDYVVVVSRDMTARCGAEESLRNLNQELEARVDARGAQLNASRSELQNALAELQAAHAELREREESATRSLVSERELSELKMRFISVTSHEFRTPLATILSAADLLTGYWDRLGLEERRQIIGDIQVAVGRMTVLLDQVLTIGRMDSGRHGYSPMPLDVEKFCRDVVAEMEMSSRGSHVILLSVTGRHPVRAFDANLLRQILTNLLANAIKYSAPGSEVRLDLALNDGETVFEVLDQGIGVTEGEKVHLFDTFFRGSNVGQIPGTGLGLSIVRRAAERHGGRVACSSAPGVGTGFTVQIPYRPD